MSAALLEVVRCKKCGVNLVPREASAMTPEQIWCGAWWDHPDVPGGRESLIAGHTTSLLFQSPALRAQLADLRIRPAAPSGPPNNVPTEEDRA